MLEVLEQSHEFTNFRTGSVRALRGKENWIENAGLKEGRKERNESCGNMFSGNMDGETLSLREKNF